MHYETIRAAIQGLFQELGWPLKIDTFLSGITPKRLLRFGSGLEQYLPPEQGLHLEDDVAPFVDYGGSGIW